MSKTGKIAHEGFLQISDPPIACYVLEDGTRVLSARGIQNALKMVDASSVDDAAKLSGTELSRFMGGKWFKSLIVSEDKLEHFVPIVCYKGKQRINGYEATVLADMCDAILEARRSLPSISPRQAAIAAQCEILMAGFARVGITALVDEATGYQNIRERDELQKILRAYVAPEVLSWQKTFHDDFYKLIFQLKGWSYTSKGIKARPGVVGKYTNSFIYDSMPPGVMIKIREQTPKGGTGEYKYRFHQSLTPEIGREHLKSQILAVTTLMRAARSWEDFVDLFRRTFGGQLSLDMDGSPTPSSPSPIKKSPSSAKALPKPQDEPEQPSLFKEQPSEPLKPNDEKPKRGRKKKDGE